MTSGRWVAIGIVVITAIFGLAQWFFQTRAYYEDVGDVALMLTLAETGERLQLAATAVEAIDADTSPLRFRACFTLDPAAAEAATPEAIATIARPYPEAAPLIAPGWFDCFDAAAIGAALQSGEARAYLSHAEIARGVDRVIAVFPDGRAFAWHQLNGTLED